MRHNRALMVVETAFRPFGGSHLIALLTIAGVSLGFALWGRSLPLDRARRVGRWLALALVVYRTAYIPVVAWLYGDPVRELLPLHVCGMLYYVCALALWKGHQLAYDIAYFWGMGGTLQALLTPEMQMAFPHPTFLSHFGGHGALMVAIVYLTLALGMRPFPGSIARALIATVAYAVVLLPLNLLLGTNYMYLVEKPAAASLLDLLGPWPWYIVAAVGVAWISYLIWYLPFVAADLAHGRWPAAREER